MNKNQEHTQQVFIRMVETCLSSAMRGEGLVSLEELANALTEQGDVNYYGQPYTAGSLHKMIQRMNMVDEESDFRQQYYPVYLQLKDNDIGWKTLTLPDAPIKRRTTKSDEELDREEMLILHEQHKNVLNKFHPSVH